MDTTIQMLVVSLVISIPAMWFIAEIKNKWFRLIFGVLSVVAITAYLQVWSNIIHEAKYTKLNQIIHDSEKLLKAGKHKEVLKALQGRKNVNEKLQAEARKLELAE